MTSLIDNNMAIKKVIATEEIKQPIRTKIPSSSKIPNPTKNIDQATDKFVNGMGSGRAKHIPRIKISKPLMMWNAG